MKHAENHGVMTNQFKKRERQTENFHYFPLETRDALQSSYIYIRKNVYHV